MAFEFQEEFLMTDKFEKIISKVISKMENKKYICKELFKGYYWSYLVVMEPAVYEVYLKFGFKEFPYDKISELEFYLENTCEVFDKYNRSFQADVFYERFPYMKTFFNALDKWREETGIATLIPDEVFENAAEKVTGPTKKRTK